MIVSDILEASLRQLGITSPTASELADAMEALNMWLAELALTMQGVTRLVRENFSLVAGTANYTIGTSQTFNTSRPQSIESAFIRISNVDYPINPKLTATEYDRISDKTTQSRPTLLFYEHAATTGTIYPYPTPDSIYDLHLSSVKPFTAYTSIADTLGLAPEYEPAIKFNLGLDLAPEFGAVVTEETMRAAIRTKAALKRAHATPVPESDTRPYRGGGKGRSYDINGDTYYK